MFIVQMVMTLLAFVLALLGAVRPPHPIFQEAPPPVEDEVPDLEAPVVADDEDPEDRKKRFRDLGAEDCETNFSGTGVMNFTAREKKLLLQIFKNCKDYWKQSNCEHHRDQRRGPQVKHYRWRPDDIYQFFRRITGVSAMSLSEIKAQRDADDEKNGPEGWVMPSKRETERTEVNKKALEVVLPDLDKFIREEIEKARKGSFLTVKILAERASAKFECTIKKHRMRRALKRLGYEYKARNGKYVNRRSEPGNLAKLKEFCEWVHANVAQAPDTGLYRFTIPVGFGDGANEYTKAFRGRSWVTRDDPKLLTSEKGRSKDSGQRLNMLGAIYSSSYDMDSFQTWNSADKGKSQYATNQDIVDHTVSHVLPNLPGGCGAVYVLDNASNNKMIEEGLRAATSTELHDWINEHDPDAPRFQRFWEEEAEAKNETELKKALFKYIRTNIEDFTKLARECKLRGVGLRYLPAYYPECNPIELIWAHIKREFKATSVDLPWKERLEIAHSKITEEQIELSFDRSIRYCLDRLVELRATAGEPGEGVHGGEAREDQVIFDGDHDEDHEEWINEM